jgi:hypothetical protein
MRTRWLFFLAVLVIVAGVGIAFYRGAGPLPDPEGCTATVAHHKVDLATDQAQNATLISAIAVRRGMPARAASIAIATAYQESKLRNLASGDRDSVGLFQQRPSQGWGTARQIRNPYYAINKFYDALSKVPDYEHMQITQAAQRVQRSGFPSAYEQHAPDARALASALTGFSAGGRFSCVVNADHPHGSAARTLAVVSRAYGPIGLRRAGVRQDLVLVVPSGSAGQRLGWSVAQFLVAHARPLHVAAIDFDGKRWTSGSASGKGWRPVNGTPGRVTVSLG